LDCNGSRAEYSRHGTEWNVIESNRQELLEKLPNVYFELTPTISLYNVWNWPDFHMDWVEKGYVDIENCRLNMLTGPDFMRIDNIPDEFKIELRAKYIHYKKWAFEKIKDRIPYKPRILQDVIGKIKLAASEFALVINYRTAICEYSIAIPTTKKNGTRNKQSFTSVGDK
jgi:hypothetical protein